jgi:hypothetical protein
MLNDRFGAVLLASALACGVTALGVVWVSRHRRWANARALYFRGFAAGMLISISFPHLVPGSLQMNPSAPAFLSAGLLTLYLTDRSAVLVLAAGVLMAMATILLGD